MLSLLGLKPKTKENTVQASNAHNSDYIKIKSVYYNFIFIVEKNYEEIFFHAEPDALIGCKPLAKNGNVQKVRTVFFRRNELTLVA